MGLFDIFKPIPDKEIEGLHLPPKPPQMEGDEEIVSVWEGSGNNKFHQRRFFEGYVQYVTVGPDGKRHRYNVYTGYWYTQQLTKQERTRHKLLNILFFLVGAAALVFACTRTIPVNTRWFAAIPSFAGLYAFCWIAVAVFNEFIVPQKRTIGDYRATSLGLKRGGMMALISSGVTFLITLGYLMAGDGDLRLNLLAAVCELLAAGMGLLVWYLERKVVYEKKLSELAGKYQM